MYGESSTDGSQTVSGRLESLSHCPAPVPGAAVPAPAVPACPAAGAPPLTSTRPASSVARQTARVLPKRPLDFICSLTPSITVRLSLVITPDRRAQCELAAPATLATYHL